MVHADDLIALWQTALRESWGYIYGKRGQIWTAAEQRAATRPQTVRHGAQWIGRHVADCSGLAYWAFEQLGGYVYHGSDTIWRQYVTGRCALNNGKRADGRQMLPGDPVFLARTEDGKRKRHHIGYFIGGDTVIEAKGTKWGVVTSTLADWHETAHWLDTEYQGGITFMVRPVLKRGSGCGEDEAHRDAVLKLQQLLNQKGYSLDADGKFGAKTQEAVRDYQAKNGQVADGVVGEATWDSLESLSSLPADGGLAGLRAALAGCLADLDRILENRHG